MKDACRRSPNSEPGILRRSGTLSPNGVGSLGRKVASKGRKDEAERARGHTPILEMLWSHIPDIAIYSTVYLKGCWCLCRVMF